MRTNKASDLKNTSTALALRRHVHSRSLGFFDADCLECAPRGSPRLSAFPGLALRERVALLTDSLRQIHTLAHRHSHPFVFTTCCSGCMPKPLQVPGVLSIPLEPNNHAWRNCLHQYSMFYIEKKTSGIPKLNDREKYWDMFLHNANAALFFRSLNVKRWVVFGNAFERCTYSAVRGLLDCGCRVLLLTDMVYGPTSSLPELKRDGVETMLFADFLTAYNLPCPCTRFSCELRANCAACQAHHAAQGRRPDIWQWCVDAPAK